MQQIWQPWHISQDKSRINEALTQEFAVPCFAPVAGAGALPVNPVQLVLPGLWRGWSAAPGLLLPSAACACFELPVKRFAGCDLLFCIDL